jgi:hypothetical protein
VYLTHALIPSSIRCLASRRNPSTRIPSADISPARRGRDDGFEDGGQEGLEFVVGEPLEYAADIAARAAVLIAKAGGNGFAEEVVVHTVERSLEHLAKKREAEESLLAGSARAKGSRR